MQIEVGKQISGWVKGLPEKVQFDFGKSGGFLLLAYNNPTNEEIDNIKRGKIKFAWAVVDELLFLLAKFGKNDWLDTPYYYYFSQPFEIGNLSKDSSQGYAVTTVLVDNNTGIVKVIRLVAMPITMSKEFEKVVTKQKEDNIWSKNPKGYDSTLEKVYKNYGTAKLLQIALKNDTIYNL